MTSSVGGLQYITVGERVPPHGFAWGGKASRRKASLAAAQRSTAKRLARETGGRPSAPQPFQPGLPCDPL